MPSLCIFHVFPILMLDYGSRFRAIAKAAFAQLLFEVLTKSEKKESTHGVCALQPFLSGHIYKLS